MSDQLEHRVGGADKSAFRNHMKGAGHVIVDFCEYLFIIFFIIILFYLFYFTYFIILFYFILLSGISHVDTTSYSHAVTQ